MLVDRVSTSAHGHFKILELNAEEKKTIMIANLYIVLQVVGTYRFWI